MGEWWVAFFFSLLVFVAHPSLACASSSARASLGLQMSSVAPGLRNGQAGEFASSVTPFCFLVCRPFYS